MPGIWCRYLLPAMLVLIPGCEGEDQIVTISGISYYLPSDHISGIVEQKNSSNDDYYIRLLVPNESYLIEYAPENRQRNKIDLHVPIIENINDIPGDKADVYQTETGIAVCRSERLLRYGCGLLISDNGLVWSVRFDRTSLSSVAAIKASAKNALLSYRTNYRLAAKLD